jgi:uncharacterized protein (DUF885 family)
MHTSHAVAFALVALVACNDVTATKGAAAPTASPASATRLDARRQQLRDVIADQWEYTMRTSPEFASILGDKRYNDRWGDRSEAAIKANLEENRRTIERLEAVDTTGFPEQERLDKVLLVRDLKLGLEAARFEGWLMPVNQFEGAHTQFAQMVSLLPFTSAKDYDDYVTRLRTFPRVMDQILDLMRAGMVKHLMPAKILLARVAQQADDLAGGVPEDSAFAAPLKSFPAGVPEVDRARIRAACVAAIKDDVDPAYRKLSAYVRAEYEPHGRAEPGEWALPLGVERYEFEIKYTTTTAMTADEIHELGLKEVARIETEMGAVAKKLGFADLPSLAAAAARNPVLHFASRQAVVDLYQKYTDQMYPKLGSLFGRLPKAKLEIRPVEEFREKGAAGAEYMNATPDGSRPGHVMVNTGDFANRTTLDVETTAYHEGVPGHHLQASVAQEVTGLPKFRQQYFVTSYVEGWALYAERLGEEVGFYQDPYSYYGHLLDEMLRAIRLVVDTGLHAKKWTRQQVVDFFHAHSTLDEVEVQAETDRYIAIPGQALAYKIGQLKILALREKAKKALGDKFDIRAFHDVVLGSGALPLDVLEQQVDRWIAERKAA